MKIRIAFCGLTVLMVALGCAQTEDLLEEQAPSDQTFEGTADSDVVPFTWSTCSWTVQFREIEFGFTIEADRRISDAFLVNDADERSTNCGTAPFQRQIYIYKSGNVRNGQVTLEFSPGENNLPKCNAQFVGTIEEDFIEGVLTWNRFDQNGSLNYKIVVPIELERTN